MLSCCLKSWERTVKVHTAYMMAPTTVQDNEQQGTESVLCTRVPCTSAPDNFMLYGFNRMQDVQRHVRCCGRRCRMLAWASGRRSWRSWTWPSAAS